MQKIENNYYYVHKNFIGFRSIFLIAYSYNIIIYLLKENINTYYKLQKQQSLKTFHV